MLYNSEWNKTKRLNIFKLQPSQSEIKNVYFNAEYNCSLTLHAIFRKLFSATVKHCKN